MSVKIHGKEYTTVAERISQLKKDHPDWALHSEIIRDDGQMIVIKATIYNENGGIRGIGHAEEVRGATKINQTSALENCETSAWGRALAACGYGGEQVASANEVSDAIINQHVNEATLRLKKHNLSVCENLEIILEVKKALKSGDLLYAAQMMYSMSDETRQNLGIATTKGGIFDLEDSKIFRSQEYSDAVSKYFEVKNHSDKKQGE